MAFLRDRFAPIKLPDDEHVILRKRESLRSRGLAWLGGVVIIVMLLAVCVTLWAIEKIDIGIVTTGINSSVILLGFSLIPTLGILLYMWGNGTYRLGDRSIRKASKERKNADLIQAGGKPNDGEWLVLNQITGVEIASSLPAKMFSLGNIVLSTNTEPRAMVIHGVERPQYWESEINRHIRLAHARARAGTTEPEDLTKYTEIRRSGAWLMLKWLLPILILLPGSVVAWVTLRLGGPIQNSTGLIFFSILTGLVFVAFAILWLVSFLRWWLKLYYVTDRRVIQRRGLLDVRRHALMLDEVVSTTVERSGVGRFIDVGNVKVMTAGLSGAVYMESVSAPDFVRQQILETQEIARRQRDQLEMAEITQRLTATLHLNSRHPAG